MPGSPVGGSQVGLTAEEKKSVEVKLKISVVVVKMVVVVVKMVVVMVVTIVMTVVFTSTCLASKE